MKILLYFYLFMVVFSNITQAQTYANIAGPENVLVVYNYTFPDSAICQVSDSVQKYYKNARNIPGSNIVRLDSLYSKNIIVDGVTHNVVLAEGGNIIRDSVNHESQTWYASQHAWKYFYQYVAKPIKDYIASNGLTSIRYIVLCKGVPFKIQAGGDHSSVICNQGVDGLLCMLNTDNYDVLLDSIYAKFRRYATPYYNYSGQMTEIANPYWDADPNRNMNYRFKPGVFTRSWNGHTIKLDYLVSHLDGINYNMVKGIIDHSSEAIHSSYYDWFIDADPAPCHGSDYFYYQLPKTKSTFDGLGLKNYFFDNTEDTITTHSKPIMTYSSNGVHTTVYPNTYCGQTFHPDYIQTQINFNYTPGAIFNTAESFNVHLLSSISRRNGAEQGQIVEFFLKGGTLGVGHVWEPQVGGIIHDSIMFPTYQVGYSFIDAAYMGLKYLAWQNAIVGDPLTTIAWGNQTLTENLTLTDTNLVIGKIIIPSGKTLTIDSNTVLNLKYLGQLEVQAGGSLIIKPGTEINFFNSIPLFVYGTLNAQGTGSNKIRFNRGDTTGYWGSIIFDGSASSSSILDFVDINYASDIQCLNNADVTIQNSIMQYCDAGIYVYNSEPRIISNEIYDPFQNAIHITGGGNEVEIYDNIIIKNDTNSQYQQGQGIWLENYSQGFIGHNDINGFNYGIYLGGGSGGYFFDTYGTTPNPNNRLIECTRGMGVGWGSYSLAGYDELGGYNTVMNNEVCDLRVYESSNVWAEYNYWGGEGGNNLVDSSSVLHDEKYLDYDPWETYLQMLAGETPNNDIVNGIELELNNNITGAVNHYKLMIGRNSYPAFALTRLAVIKKRHNINNIQEYLVNLLDSNRPYKPIIMNLLAGLSLKSNNYSQALDLYNSIIQNFPNSYYSVNALFESFFAALNYAKDFTAASQILSEIQALNLNDEEYLMRLASAEDLLDRFNGSQNLSKSNNPTKGNSEENLPKDYSLSQNYPNPFNPVTTINYQIPKDGRVIIKIYDILGNEVRTLVDENKTTGRYTVVFNANSLSSGIYIYRIQAGEYTASRKMTLIK